MQLRETEDSVLGDPNESKEDVQRMPWPVTGKTIWWYNAKQLS